MITLHYSHLKLQAVIGMKVQRDGREFPKVSSTFQDDLLHGSAPTETIHFFHPVVVVMTTSIERVDLKYILA